MTAESIADALTLRRAGANRWRGACPCCGGSSRFQVRAGREGPLVYCWSCRDSAAIIRALQDRGLWPRSEWTAQQRRDWIRQRQRDNLDRRPARLFADVAHILTEQALEEMSPFHPDRAVMTRLLATLRTEAGALSEYRGWRRLQPRITQASVEAGLKHEMRLSMLLMNWLEAGPVHAA